MVKHEFGRRPRDWDPNDLARSYLHQRRLQGVVDAVQPGFLAPGHLHRRYRDDLEAPWGRLRVVGLAEDGTFASNILQVDTSQPRSVAVP